jgi:hypothetical protein
MSRSSSHVRPPLSEDVIKRRSLLKGIPFAGGLLNIVEGGANLVQGAVSYLRNDPEIGEMRMTQAAGRILPGLYNTAVFNPRMGMPVPTPLPHHVTAAVTNPISTERKVLALENQIRDIEKARAQGGEAPSRDAERLAEREVWNTLLGDLPETGWALYATGKRLRGEGRAALESLRDAVRPRRHPTRTPEAEKTITAER